MTLLRACTLLDKDRNLLLPWLLLNLAVMLFIVRAARSVDKSLQVAMTLQMALKVVIRLVTRL